jgi:hypothetical protein
MDIVIDCGIAIYFLWCCVTPGVSAKFLCKNTFGLFEGECDKKMELL